jgi:hypothetical protein
MAKATLILDQGLEISERYRVELKVFKVDPSERFPDGIKVSFALLDVIDKVPRLLVDNHAPFGFHVHTELPKNKQVRKPLVVKNYQEALDEFLRLVKGIVENET